MTALSLNVMGVDKRRTGRRTADDGRRTTDGGRRTADGGRRTTDGGRRTADGGRRTADGGRRTTDGGAFYKHMVINVLFHPFEFLEIKFFNQHSIRMYHRINVVFLGKRFEIL